MLSSLRSGQAGRRPEGCRGASAQLKCHCHVAVCTSRPVRASLLAAALMLGAVRSIAHRHKVAGRAGVAGYVAHCSEGRED